MVYPARRLKQLAWGYFKSGGRDEQSEIVKLITRPLDFRLPFADVVEEESDGSRLLIHVSFTVALIPCSFRRSR